MSRDNDPKEFTAIFNHELIHSYHYSLNLDKKMSENQFMSYTTGAYHIYMPSGLIPLPK
jgi:hypothetical protein